MHTLESAFRDGREKQAPQGLSLALPLGGQGDEEEKRLRDGEGTAREMGEPLGSQLHPGEDRDSVPTTLPL